MNGTIVTSVVENGYTDEVVFLTNFDQSRCERDETDYRRYARAPREGTPYFARGFKCWEGGEVTYPPKTDHAESIERVSEAPFGLLHVAIDTL